MNCGSLFAGIGGFDAGLSRAGIGAAFQVEIDPQCRSVLRRHFPDVAQYDDVRRVRAWLERKDATRLIRPDVLCGGFPCQDLSVAGRRAGLAGSRSGLWFTFRRIAALLRPRWILIENVDGLRSSNGGKDLGTIVGALGHMGYGWAYRVFDSQWFGLAQRRERVFIVGSLGNWRRAAEILFEPDCLPWHPAPSRGERQATAACLTSGAHPGSHNGQDDHKDGRLIPIDMRQASRGGTMTNNRRDGTTGGAPGTGIGDPGDPAFTVCESHPPAIALGAQWRGRGMELGSDVACALRSAGEGHVSDHAGYAVTNCVRRLTPKECERLQGFPDEWTRFGADGEEMSDSARYRMLGNAVSVPVVEWIGRRIVEASRQLAEAKEEA